jgi:hypothetical protein
LVQFSSAAEMICDLHLFIRGYNVWHAISGGSVQYRPENVMVRAHLQFKKKQLPVQTLGALLKTLAALPTTFSFITRSTPGNR